MPNYVQLARPQRRPHAVRNVARAGTFRRDIRQFPTPSLDVSPVLFPASRSTEPGPGPHLDYARRLTPEGGVHITYKDLDVRLRQIVARVFAYAVFTGLEAWLLLTYSPLQSEWINDTCLLVMAGLNFLILWRLPEVHRSVEIRPDCMILEGVHVFWLGLMESLPSFRRDENNNQVLSGIYGTRHVEYLTARRFDEHDRMPEVLAAHFENAIRQIWDIPKPPDERPDGSSPRQRR